MRGSLGALLNADENTVFKVRMKERLLAVAFILSSEKVAIPREQIDACLLGRMESSRNCLSYKNLVDIDSLCPSPASSSTPFENVKFSSTTSLSWLASCWLMSTILLETIRPSWHGSFLCMFLHKVRLSDKRSMKSVAAKTIQLVLRVPSACPGQVCRSTSTVIPHVHIWIFSFSGVFLRQYFKKEELESS